MTADWRLECETFYCSANDSEIWAFIINCTSIIVRSFIVECYELMMQEIKLAVNGKNLRTYELLKILKANQYFYILNGVQKMQ